MRIEVKVALITAAAVIVAALIPIVFSNKSNSVPPYPGPGPDSVQPIAPVKPKELHDRDPQGNLYSIEWHIDPNCDNFHSPEGPMGTKLACHLSKAGISIPHDNTPFNLWDFTVETPGPVSDISCRPTGSNEPIIAPYNQHTIQGNSANCTGLINGGDGDVVVTVTWKQLW